MKRVLALALCLPLAAGESWAPAADKRGHFLGGFAIGATVTLGFRWSGGTPRQSARIGFMAGSAAGLQKEYLDSASNRDANAWGLKPVHSVSTADAAYTIAGAALGSFVSWQFIKNEK